MHLQNNEQRQKKAGPGSPLPVPPSGYEYGPVGTDVSPVKYVIVDLNKLYVGSLWHSSLSRVSTYTKIARKVTDENDPKYNPVSPYAGLKAVSNGTFVYTKNLPAGHLVGFEQADQLFASKDVNYWPWDAGAGWDPRKRWGFAVLHRGSDGVDALTIKIDKGAGLVPDPLPQGYATSEYYLEDKYMILIHGGYVLFKPGTLPKSTLNLPESAPAGSRSYKEKFNSVNNDLFGGANAYIGITGNLPKGRWAIGCISGSSKIVIFSSRNEMTVYDFAKTIRDNTFGDNDIEEAIIFDGGSAQGFQAVTDIKYNINDDNVTGQPDKVDCQHQSQSSNSHFAVFKIQNVAMISIEGRKVPCNYSIDDKVIPVLVDRATNTIKFRIKVAESEFFRKTYKVQMQLVSRDLYDNGVWMPSLQIVKTLDRSQITFGSDMDIELVNVDNHGNHVNEKHKALGISLDNNKGAVCILRAFDKNDEEISRQAVTVKFFTGIRIGLLLDKSPDTASVAVQAARNKAAMMIGCRALAKAKIPITGATTLTGFPTELCVIGFADTGDLVMDWSDNETDFETAIGNLYCGPGSDFYNGFRVLRIRFNAIESTDGPHYCRGFFFAASKHQSHLHTFPEVLQQVGFFNPYIPVHCIGCVSADIPSELTQIANTAGGKVYPASAVSDLVDLFIKAYTEDQEEEYIKTLKEPLVPGGVVTVTVKLKTRELATFQVYWEDTVAPNIVIKRPNGRAIAAEDTDVEVISGQGFTIYMVENPRKDVSKKYDWKVEVTGRGKTGRGNMVCITVSAEKGETYSETQIVLQHEDVPGIVEQGVDMTVEVFANQFYMSPDRITFLIRHEDETEFTLYELMQQSEDRWQTVVPGTVFRPGVFYSYFEAEAEGLECRFPADTAFMTEVEGGGGRGNCPGKSSGFKNYPSR